MSRNFQLLHQVVTEDPSRVEPESPFPPTATPPVSVAELPSTSHDIDAMVQRLFVQAPHPPRKVVFYDLGNSAGTDRPFEVAVSLAKAGKSVCFIDLEAEPSDSKTSPSLNVGFHDLLETPSVPLDQVAHRLANTPLYLMNAGRYHNGMTSSDLEKAVVRRFTEMKGTFEFVLVRSRTGLGSPHSRTLRRFAEGVIVMLEAGKTRRLIVKQLLDELRRENTRILGVVFDGQSSDLPAWAADRL